MSADDERVVATSAGEPASAELRSAQRGWLWNVVMPIALLAVLVLMRWPWGPPQDMDSSVIAVFAILGLSASGLSVARYLRRGKRACSPRACRAASSIDCALGATPLAFGYVTAILYHSSWLYVLALVPVAVVWFWVFPRERVWRKWTASHPELAGDR